MRFEDFEHFRVRTDVQPPVLAHEEPCQTTIDDEIGDNTSVATLMRAADRHRPFCQYGFAEPEATAEAQARWETVWLLYADKHDSIAFLQRQKGTELWDVIYCGDKWDRRISGNGVSYEQGLLLVFQTMGDRMPQEITVSRT